MDKRPDGPYVSQPYGSQSYPAHAEAGRLWGVSGISTRRFLRGELKGLTKAEAEAIVAILSPEEGEDDG